MSKSTKTESFVNGLTVKVNKNDREKAKKIELPVQHYRVLRALRKSRSRNGLTYKEIAKLTGHYPMLTKVCRAGKEGSLSELGLVTEAVKEVDGRECLSFVLTAKGKKVNL